ncbi:MAG: ankyrin repeat domain-containing protein [Saprospirales bacterium]|nr:ankyrin repeat domain-containing protein [Saprospirales bacterium]MBK7337005.1 ankyrin repeat domain-containing protein [Saprospirales bacterium]
MKIPPLLDAIFAKDEARFLAFNFEYSEFLYVDKSGRSLLHNAILENLPSIIMYLIDNVPEVLKMGDNKGLKPLHYCALKNDIKTAKLILEKGVNIDLIDSYGNTPLWRAVFEAREEKYEVVLFFIQNGANPTIKNNTGISPLDFARKVDDQKLINILLRKEGSGA